MHAAASSRHGLASASERRCDSANTRFEGSKQYPEAGTPQGGVITPPTAWKTFLTSTLSRIVIRRRIRRRVRRQPVDDRGPVLVNFDSSNERSDQVPPLHPREVVEAVAYSLCK